MISYEVYKIIHLTSLILLFTGFVVLLTMKITNVPLEGSSRKFAFLTHGIGMFFLLVSGFGLLARLGIVQAGLPNWIYVKLAIWLYFGAIVALIKRKGHLGWKLYIPLITVFIFAAYVAINKPAF